MEVTVIGAGLAGCEAAWQLAERGIHVTLTEMKPHKMTPAHHCADFAELVCSNSLRGDRLENAVGLLKEELRRLRQPDPDLRGGKPRRGRRRIGRRPLRLFRHGDGENPVSTRTSPSWRRRITEVPAGAGHHCDRSPDLRRDERCDPALFRRAGVYELL